MIVGVIGSGSIGPDLAYGFVSALVNDADGIVYLHDIQQSALDAGVSRIHGYLKKGVSRGKISERQATLIHERLRPTLDPKDLANCDYVLEAATENLPIKRVILRQIEEIVSPDCLIGFATSGIPRAEIARDAIHPDRCFVNHPFYPAWRALPIEIVLSDNAAMGKRMIDTMKLLGKVPIVTSDVPCFAADDIFCNYCSEAARLVAEGVATPAQVDEIVHRAIGGGGPLNVLDLTRGNLLTAHCQELMRDGPTGGAWFEPPEILSTQGNELWHAERKKAEPYDEKTKNTVLDRILAVLFSRTLFVYEQGICSATELDWMTRMALGFREGLLSLALKTGGERVQALCRAYGHVEDGFYIPNSLTKDSDFSFYRTVTVEQEDGIATVSIYRPEVKNALNNLTIDELGHAMEALRSDDAVTGIVVTGFEGALVGADIGDLSKLKTQEEGEATCVKGQALFNAIEDFPKPVVAALNGPIMGGGAELSMSCHARVVGRKLMLSQPEVNLGLIPGYGGSQRLPRLIDLDKAFHMLRTGTPINAEKAFAWGWASVLAEGSVLKAARELLVRHRTDPSCIQRIDQSPMTLPERLPNIDIGHRSRVIDAILLDVMQRGLSSHLREGLKLEAQGVGRAVVTVDFDIGIKNFFQNGPRVPAVFMHE
ncbi:MAG: enoyl-CoA hydratase-related protein [Myxococcota bacterium]|nr:enoyl-CoA hydratase-related protein [Myxococcota bacterium]